MNISISSRPAAAFIRRVCAFYSSTDPPGAAAAAMLMLSLCAYRAESGQTEPDIAELAELAFSRSCEGWQEETLLDDLLTLWHQTHRSSMAWEFYSSYRDNAARIRHAALSVLAGGFWAETFLSTAEETVRQLMD